MKKLLSHQYFIKENIKSKVINSNQIHKLIKFLAIPERFYPQLKHNFPILTPNWTSFLKEHNFLTKKARYNFILSF